MNKRWNAMGFTLVEILIALSIFSIMAVITSTVLFSVFNARDRTTEHAVRLSQLQITFILIERDLTQIVNRPIRTATNLENALLGQIDTLSFSRGGMINPLFKKKQSSLARVRYSLKNQQLIRQNEMAVDRSTSTEPYTEVLLNNVEQLKFNYIDKNGQKQQQWYDKKLPKAVRITIQHKYWGELSQIYALTQAHSYDKKFKE